MIGQLPASLIVGGKEYAIRSDYRVILNIFQAFTDPELTNEEKCLICLKCLYVDAESIPQEDMQEAIEKAYCFVEGGDIPKSPVSKVKIFDWEQDERLIFSAVNKVAGFETRAVKYMHWFTFLGLFSEIGDGLFSQVMHIRQKKAKGKKLEKWEREFEKEHKDMILLKEKQTEKQQREDREDEEFLSTII